MRAVFMGTPALAATVLGALAARHEVAAVFTRPDAVRGRGRKLAPSPVKKMAQTLGIEVHERSSLRDSDTLRLVRALEPEVICVAAYGAILPPAMLGVPPRGCLNVHTSLLPRWRGAAPIERAILARDEQAGVCIMKMEEGLDTGPYCTRKATTVEGKYLSELSDELAALGAEALLETLRLVQSDAASWTPQPQAGITYARKIEKGELDPEPGDAPACIAAKVRASSSSHPSRIVIAGRRVAVERAHAVKNDQPESVGAELAPGEAAFVSKRLLIGATGGIVELERVKPEGKGSMEGRAFAAGIQGIKDTRASWGRA